MRKNYFTGSTYRNYRGAEKRRGSSWQISQYTQPSLDVITLLVLVEKGVWLALINIPEFERWNSRLSLKCGKNKNKQTKNGDISYFRVSGPQVKTWKKYSSRRQNCIGLHKNCLSLATLALTKFYISSTLRVTNMPKP